MGQLRLYCAPADFERFQEIFETAEAPLPDFIILNNGDGDGDRYFDMTNDGDYYSYSSELMEESADWPPFYAYSVSDYCWAILKVGNSIREFDTDADQVPQISIYDDSRNGGENYYDRIADAKLYWDLYKEFNLYKEMRT